jgi:hypothetical protein
LPITYSGLCPLSVEKVFVSLEILHCFSAYVGGGIIKHFRLQKFVEGGERISLAEANAAAMEPALD